MHCSNGNESDNASIEGDTDTGSSYASQFDPPRNRNRSRHLKEFVLLNTIGKGTYGTVWRAKDKENDANIVALKSVHMLERMDKDGVSKFTAREISLLSGLRHENIVRLNGTVTEQGNKALWLSFEYCEHDMSVLMEHMQNDFTLPQIKNLTRQLLSAVDHMHRNFIMHRDIKIANLLYNNDGVLKLCDFGMARQFEKPCGAYTQNVCTLWYRGPELLFGATKYTQALDLWAVGCVIAEWLLHRTALPGDNERRQIDLIIDLIGTPDRQHGRNILESATWKNGDYPERIPSECQISTIFDKYSKGTHELLRGCLTWDPFKRWNCNECFNSGWFEERPPIAKDMPSFRQHRNDDKAAPVIPSRSHKNFMSQFKEVDENEDNSSQEKTPSCSTREDAKLAQPAQVMSVLSNVSFESRGGATKSFANGEPLTGEKRSFSSSSIGLGLGGGTKRAIGPPTKPVRILPLVKKARQ